MMTWGVVQSEIWKNKVSLDVQLALTCSNLFLPLAILVPEVADQWTREWFLPTFDF